MPAYQSPQTDTPATPAEKSRMSTIELGFLVATILGCAVAMSPNQADPDLWGHVTYGLDAFRDGLPATTTYSYTAAGYRWINHENIAEVILAVTATSGGAVGLLVLKCLIGIAIIGMIAWWGRRRGVPLTPLAVVLIIVALNMAYRWAVRPQIFSYLYFTALVLLLSWSFQGWSQRWHLPWARRMARSEGEPRDLNYSSTRLRWLWLAPVVLFFWANTHGGFVAGLCIYSAYLGLRGIEALLVRGRQGWGLARRMALMIVCGWLATLINPYGFGLHSWLLGSLGVPRPEISEWSSLRIGAEPFLPFVAMMLIALPALIWSRKPLDATHLALLAIVTWQAISHERHIGFVAVLFGFWLPSHVESFFTRIGFSKPDGSLEADRTPRGRRWLAAGLCVVFCILSVRLGQRLSDMPVYKDKYPVEAMQYIADRNLTGRMVVTFNWAQYAIAALGPSTPEADDGLLVMFDGRFRTCYPQEVVDMHFDFILGDGPPGARHRAKNSGKVDGTKALALGRPNVLLINREQYNSVEVMQTQTADWVLLYQDSLAQVWGRRAIYDDRALASYIAPVDRDISDREQQGSVCWPALPTRNTNTALGRIINPTREPSALAAG